MNIGLHTAISNYMELTTLGMHQCPDGVLNSVVDASCTTRGEEPVIDTLTGKVVPNCFIKVHRFLRAGTENREWVAYLAHKGTEDWPYKGMPLSTVITYLKWRGML